MVLYVSSKDIFIVHQQLIIEKTTLFLGFRGQKIEATECIASFLFLTKSKPKHAHLKDFVDVKLETQLMTLSRA